MVVVNHHLFLADMVVKESGFGELIPEADVMIFDEAHQLPDIASQYFGQSLSSRQLLDGKRHHHRLPHRIKRHPAVTKCADRLAQSAQDFRLQLGEPGYRGNLRELLANPQIQRAFYCSMTLWNFVMTWRNCRWGVPPCWMRHLSAPRCIARG